MLVPALLILSIVFSMRPVTANASSAAVLIFAPFNPWIFVTKLSITVVRLGLANLPATPAPNDITVPTNIAVSEISLIVIHGLVSMPVATFSKHIGCKFVVIDANDLGVEVLGRSSEDISIDFCKQVFKDNPLDQSDQQTPVCIVRQVK